VVRLDIAAQKPSGEALIESFQVPTLEDYSVGCALSTSNLS